MNPIGLGLNPGIFFIPIFLGLFWILGFVCLIQFLRFLTKGIKALDIYIDNNKKDKIVHPDINQNDLQ